MIFLPTLVAFTYLLEKKNALQLIMILKVTIYEQMTPKWLENKEVALKRPGSPNGWLLNWTDIPPRRAIQHPAIPNLYRKGKTGFSTPDK